MSNSTEPDDALSTNLSKVLQAMKGIRLTQIEQSISIITDDGRFPDDNDEELEKHIQNMEDAGKVIVGLSNSQITGEVCGLNHNGARFFSLLSLQEALSKVESRADREEMQEATKRLKDYVAALRLEDTAEEGEDGAGTSNTEGREATEIETARIDAVDNQEGA